MLSVFLFEGQIWLIYKSFHIIVLLDFKVNGYVFDCIAC